MKTYRAAGRTTAERIGDYRAYGEWITRVHGKPVERVETVAGGADVKGMSEQERSDWAARILEQHPGLAYLDPREGTPGVHPNEQTGS